MLPGLLMAERISSATTPVNRKVRLTLDDETIDKGTDIGDGNL
jgi:hypothetical protein